MLYTVVDPKDMDRVIDSFTAHCKFNALYQNSARNISKDEWAACRIATGN